MRNLALILAVGFISFQAVANNSSVPMTATEPVPVRFTKITKIPESARPKNFDTLLGSVGRLNVSPSCTGTRLTSLGHILTAFHCIYSCLLFANTKTPGLLTYTDDGVKIDESKLKNVVCEASPETENFELGGNFRVLAVGSTKFLQGDTVKSLPVSDNTRFQLLRDKGYTGYGDYNDFAIIQQLAPSQNTAVAKLSCDDSFPGKLWSVSFPYYSDESGVLHYYQRRFTSGNAISSIEQTSIMNYVKSGEMTIEEARATYFNSKFIVSSLDAGPGSSGSAIFNGKGEVSGVVVVAVKDDGNADGAQYEFGSSIAISVSHIKKVLQTKLPSDLVRNFSACEH